MEASRDGVVLKALNMQNVILKNLPVKGLCGKCLSVWGPEPHCPPPLHIIYVYAAYLLTQERGGGVETERSGEGQPFTKLGRKYQHEWLYL